MITATSNSPLSTITNYSEEKYILIVEDSPIDFEIVSRAFKKVEFYPQIHHCENGDDALDFLDYAISDIPPKDLPHLVLLDLNMPGTGGREVLAEIKESDNLSKLPIIILSSSNNEQDISFCLSKGADKFLKKPISTEEFAKTAEEIKEFWKGLPV